MSGLSKLDTLLQRVEGKPEVVIPIGNPKGELSKQLHAKLVQYCKRDGKFSVDPNIKNFIAKADDKGDVFAYHTRGTLFRLLRITHVNPDLTDTFHNNEDFEKRFFEPADFNEAGDLIGETTKGNFNWAVKDGKLEKLSDKNMTGINFGRIDKAPRPGDPPHPLVYAIMYINTENERKHMAERFQKEVVDTNDGTNAESFHKKVWMIDHMCHDVRTPQDEREDIDGTIAELAYQIFVYQQKDQPERTWLMAEPVAMTVASTARLARLYIQAGFQLVLEWTDNPMSLKSPELKGLKWLHNETKQQPPILPPVQPPVLPPPVQKKKRKNTKASAGHISGGADEDDIVVGCQAAPLSGPLRKLMKMTDTSFHERIRDLAMNHGFEKQRANMCAAFGLMNTLEHSGNPILDREAFLAESKETSTTEELVEVAKCYAAHAIDYEVVEWNDPDFKEKLRAHVKDQHGVYLRVDNHHVAAVGMSADGRDIVCLNSFGKNYSYGGFALFNFDQMCQETMYFAAFLPVKPEMSA